MTVQIKWQTIIVALVLLGLPLLGLAVAAPTTVKVKIINNTQSPYTLTQIYPLLSSSSWVVKPPATLYSAARPGHVSSFELSFASQSKQQLPIGEGNPSTPTIIYQGKGLDGQAAYCVFAFDTWFNKNCYFASTTHATDGTTTCVATSAQSGNICNMTFTIEYQLSL